MLQKLGCHGGLSSWREPVTKSTYIDPENYLGIPVPNTCRYQYREPLSLNFWIKMVVNLIRKKTDKILEKIMIRVCHIPCAKLSRSKFNP